MLQQDAHSEPPAVDPGLYSRFGHAEQSSDLSVGQSLQHPQHERGAVVGGQAGHGLPHRLRLSTGDELFFRTALRTHQVAIQLFQRQVPVALTQQCEALIDEDAAQPCSENAPPAVFAEGAVGFEESILDRVGSLVAVREHAGSETVHPLTVAFDELPEGMLIAQEGLVYQKIVGKHSEGNAGRLVS